MTLLRHIDKMNLSVNVSAGRNILNGGIMLSRLRTRLYLWWVCRPEDDEMLVSVVDREGNERSSYVELLHIIDAELEKSSACELYLSHWHVSREKSAILAAISSLGGPKALATVYSFEEAQRKLSSAVFTMLEDLCTYYHGRAVHRVELMKKKYDHHLSSVLGALLEACFEEA